MFVFWFIVIVSFVNLFLFIVWSKNSFANALLKMYFLITVIVGAGIAYNIVPEQLVSSIMTVKDGLGQ